MKHSITTEININASAANIWNQLIAVEDYPQWNPFIKSIKGNLMKGSKIKAHIDGMKFEPVILELEPNKKLVWLGKLLFNGLFDGEHSFQITENKAGGCTFIQSENFSGILVGLFRKKLDTDTKEGFNAMNRALKERVELAEVQV